MAIRVITIGDSTMDDFFWRLLENPDLKVARSSTVEGRLQSILGRGCFEVVSLAFDGFTTKAILNGDNIGAVLPKYTAAYPLYKTEKAPTQSFIKPLEELQKEISKDPNACHYVVLSVGGNDFRENLSNPIRLVKEIFSVSKRYLQIVEKIKNLNSRNIRPILMFQYRTDAKNDLYKIYTVLKIIGIVALLMQIGSFALLTSSILVLAGKVSALVGVLSFAVGILGLHLSKKLLPLSALKGIFTGKKISMLCFDSLLQTFYRPILQQAKKDNIPILDLPNTFNPYEDLYDHGIEPGKKGSELIAEGIAHVIKNHDYSNGSKLYSKKEREYKAVENQPSKWKVDYPTHKK